MRRGIILGGTLAGLLLLSACGGDGGQSREEVPAQEQAVASADTAAPSAEHGALWQDYQSGLARAAAEGKYVLIDFWTGWCHWCKVMDKETYGDEAVLRRLAADFVAVKVDAESQAPQGDDPATPSGRDLAREYQVSSYPTTWFVDAEGAKIAPLPGYVKPEQFLQILDFIASGAYRTQNFQDYQSARESG